MTRPADPWANPPKGLRIRARASGLRVWWEPSAAARAAGFAVVELDADRPTWSRRKADDINRAVARKTSGKVRVDGRRTVAALADAYLRSSQFHDLRPATRRDYTEKSRRVCERLGHELVSTITKPMLYDWYDDLRGSTGVRMAQALIRMTSTLMTHAERIGWRDGGTNPALNMKIKQPAPRGRVATWDELDALLAACDAAGEAGMANAICAAAFGGQRRTDIANMTLGQFSQMQGPAGPVIVLSLVRSKRMTAGVLPVHPEWDRRLRLILAAGAGPDTPMVTTADGRPCSAQMFRDRYDDARAAAARTVPSVTTLQFRDLRRTFGALARQAGATKDDVAAVLGNSAATNFALGTTYMPPELQASARAVGNVKRKL